MAQPPLAPGGMLDGSFIHMVQGTSISTKHVVALFDASDDTADMVKRMLDASGYTCLIGCQFSDLKKGRVDMARYLAEHQPEVVIFDISAPYLENWQFFQALRESKEM